MILKITWDYFMEMNGIKLNCIDELVTKITKCSLKLKILNHTNFLRKVKLAPEIVSGN